MTLTRRRNKIPGLVLLMCCCCYLTHKAIGQQPPAYPRNTGAAIGSNNYNYYSSSSSSSPEITTDSIVTTSTSNKFSCPTNQYFVRLYVGQGVVGGDCLENGQVSPYLVGMYENACFSLPTLPGKHTWPNQPTSIVDGRGRPSSSSPTDLLPYPRPLPYRGYGFLCCYSHTAPWLTVMVLSGLKRLKLKDTKFGL